MQKFVCFAAVACFVAASPAEEIDGGNVKVEFIGSSGGIKLYPRSDAEKYIMIQQSKLEEIDSDGKKVSGAGKMMQMAGSDASWTAVSSEQKDGGVEIFSTQFSKTSGDKKFTLMAHLSRTTTTVTEPVLCDGCASGSGECQNATICVDATGEQGDVCDADPSHTLCTETSSYTSDQLKFSIKVKGWDFADPTNKLTYSIFIKDRGTDDGTSLPPALDESGGVETVTVADGFFQAPSGLGAAKIHGGATVVDANVDVVLGTQGGKTSIDFTFDSWPLGDELFYDPDIGVKKETKSPATKSFAGLSVLAAALPFFF